VRARGAVLQTGVSFDEEPVAPLADRFRVNLQSVSCRLDRPALVEHAADHASATLGSQRRVRGHRISGGGQALTGALCHVVHAATGFTNHSLRGLVAGLLGHDYTTSQMTYDLRRLRLHGLIERVPHTNT
jgi:hypothetical protein